MCLVSSLFVIVGGNARHITENKALKKDSYGFVCLFFVFETDDNNICSWFFLEHCTFNISFDSTEGIWKLEREKRIQEWGQRGENW